MTSETRSLHGLGAQPEQLADDILAMVEATARLGLCPEGRADEGDLVDVLERVQRRLVLRMGGAPSRDPQPGSNELGRLGGRVSER